MDDILKEFAGFGEFLDGIGSLHQMAVDKVHASLVHSTILASKPERVLELGIGSGLLSFSILHALKYNQRGHLVSVDNWRDFEGGGYPWVESSSTDRGEPAHVSGLRKFGAERLDVMVADEREFVEKCQPHSFDIIVVDGNHKEGHLWAEKVLEICRPEGIVFSHDVLEYRNLIVYRDLAVERGFGFRIFSKSSLPGERCERGLMVIFKSSRPVECDEST